MHTCPHCAKKFEQPITGFLGTRCPLCLHALDPVTVTAPEEAGQF